MQTDRFRQREIKKKNLDLKFSFHLCCSSSFLFPWPRYLQSHLLHETPYPFISSHRCAVSPEPPSSWCHDVIPSHSSSHRHGLLLALRFLSRCCLVFSTSSPLLFSLANRISLYLSPHLFFVLFRKENLLNQNIYK